MYKMTFLDKTIFLGGNIQNSLWDKIPNKSIIKWEHKIGDKTFVFEGYEAYNYFVEKTSIINLGREYVSKIFLLAKYKNQVLKIEINFETGKVKKFILPFGQEHNKRPTRGWKQGFLLPKPSCKLI